MKILVKKTKEILNVADYTRIYVDRGSDFFSLEDIEFIPDSYDIQPKESKKSIDWEQRRYEMAKCAASSLLNNPNLDMLSDGSAKYNAEWCIKFADSIISKLKSFNS